VFSGDPLQAIPIPIAEEFFTDAEDFPYFVNAWTLNSQKPSSLLFWVNGTNGRPCGIYEVTVPETSKDPIDVTFLTAVGGSIYDIVSGGFTNGMSNPNLLVLLNNTHLLVSLDGESLSEYVLPTTYADPVHFTSFTDNYTVPILGPIAHGKTVSLAVSPADSDVIAVTGWPVDLNRGEEEIWLTTDGAQSWIDITGNLNPATQTVARMRPSGLLFMDYPNMNTSAILVGTVSGVYVSWTDSAMQAVWSRLGLLSDLPLVMVYHLSYEPYSDTLVCATFGRGVYLLENARGLILKARQQQIESNCGVSGTFNPPSAAPYFPPQESC